MHTLPLSAPILVSTEPTSVRHERVSFDEVVDLIERGGEAMAKAAEDADRELYRLEMREIAREAVERELNKSHADIREAKAPTTRRVYTADIKRFKEYCDEGELSFCPADPEIVALFLINQVKQHEASPGTLSRLRAAISYAHKIERQFDPTDDVLVREVVRHFTAHHQADASVEHH